MFLHKVIAGAADRSYGVHVARLAGLPDNVLHRAEQILTQLEVGEHGAADAADLIKSLPLFDHRQFPKKPSLPSAFEVELAAIDVDAHQLETDTVHVCTRRCLALPCFC